MTQSQPSSSFAHLAVRSAPRINDPRELQTILITSLRALWGDLETHSGQVTVVSGVSGPGDYRRDASSDSGDEDEQDEVHLLFVTCPVESVPAVRAALTVVTPPPYLADTVYCLDVVSIRVEGGAQMNES